MLTDLASLLDSLPTFAALRPLFDTRAIHVEDEFHDDTYEVRAELPGVDPDEDIEVTVCDGRLTITAERAHPGENCGRAEFTYGTLTRTLALPDGADQDDVNATYDRGILTVSVPLLDRHRLQKHVEVVEIVALEESAVGDDDDALDTDENAFDTSDQQVSDEES
ncbi:alpha-crystallin HspX [Mycolicibacterium hippocampi]|uniref:Alpha-crystallin n=2 Tax=Mycolicibacterium hippocampi TaxID=659824 RepID=A0A7I9ZTR3_9MYCO|nr:alpha-crystallin [Mycolicibacterium hippocampi]